MMTFAPYSIGDRFGIGTSDFDPNTNVGTISGARLMSLKRSNVFSAKSCEAA
jgi:hypothetical protein